MIFSASNTQLSTSAVGNRFMYTGREWISELNIYDYRHRFYFPLIGRFLQTDPTGFDAGDMNLFRYCGDDPIDQTDPTGLYAKGKGWTDETWKRFNAAQFEAAKELDKARALTERALRVHKKSSDSEKKEAAAAKNAFEKVFGKGSATNENMRAVAKTMNDMASALRDTHYRTANAVTNDFMIANNWGSNTAGHAWENGRGIDINIQIPAFNDRTELRWTAAHESGHNFGLHDFVWKPSAKAPLPELSASQALTNSDHVVEFAFRP